MEHWTRRRVLQATPALLTVGMLPVPVQAQPTAPGAVVAWPDVTLLDGSRWPASRWAGRAAVVVFWSTTCPFCRRHNEHVEKLYRAATSKNMLVLGAARESDAAVVRRYARAQGYSFPITLEHAKLSAVLSSRRVIPLTVTVDAQGRLLRTMAGEMFEEDVMELLQLAPHPTRS